MTEFEALNIVKGYLINHTLQPNLIDPDLQNGRKSPDFEVKENGITIFLCEVKTPSLILDQETQVFKWQTTISKLRVHIHKGVKQFSDYDPMHTKPWVITFVSEHMQLNWTNFQHCLAGAVGYNNTIVKDLRHERFVTNINEDLSNVDMFLWLQVGQAKKIIQQRQFINSNSIYTNKINIISDMLIPYPEEKIV